MSFLSLYRYYRFIGLSIFESAWFAYKARRQQGR